MASAELIEPPSSSSTVIAEPDEGPIGAFGESGAGAVRARQACRSIRAGSRATYSSPTLWPGPLAHWKNAPTPRQARTTKARSASPIRTRRNEGRLPDGFAMEMERGSGDLGGARAGGPSGDGEPATAPAPGKADDARRDHERQAQRQGAGLEKLLERRTIPIIER